MPQGPVMSRLTSLGPRCRAINKSKGLPIPVTLSWAIKSSHLTLNALLGFTWASPCTHTMLAGRTFSGVKNSLSSGCVSEVPSRNEISRRQQLLHHLCKHIPAKAPGGFCNLLPQLVRPVPNRSSDISIRMLVPDRARALVLIWVSVGTP